MRSCWSWLLAGLGIWLSMPGITWAQPQGNQTRIYGSGQSLLWWQRPANLPVLATSDNTLAGTPPGALGQPGTTVLLSDDLGTCLNAGARFTAGMWLDQEQTFAFEGNYFFLSQDTASRSFSSPGGAVGTPTIYRPFFDATLLSENAQFIAGPAMSGSLNVTLMQRMMGSEANLRALAWDNGSLRCDLLGGFRFLSLDENLDIQTLSLDPAGLMPPINTYESFAARNRFYGGQLGMETEIMLGRSCFVKVLTKFALGDMNQVVDVFGNAVLGPPASVSGPATLFAQATNIGRYERNQLAFIPEIGLSGGCWLTDFCKVSLGYTFLWISNVARPEDAIDRVTNIPTVGLPPPAGATHPAFIFQDASFWAQGINLGLELRF